MNAWDLGILNQALPLIATTFFTSASDSIATLFENKNGLFVVPT